MAGILVGSAKIAVLPSFDGFLASAKAQTVAALSAVDAQLPVRFTVDAASVAAARAQLGVLAGGRNVPLRFTVDKASVAAARAQLGPLAGQTIPIKYAVDSTGLAPATAATTRAGVAAGLAAKQVSLFGGAFGKIPILGAVGGLALVTHGVIDLAAVLVPAGVALATFGVAAIPTIQSITAELKNMNTVANATGQSVGPLTGGFSRLAAAVKPEVYQLFGDALLIAGHNTGTLTTLATGAGRVVDGLATRFTLAVTSGHGFTGFLGTANTDLAKLGSIVGNVGGIFGSFFQAVPGYATQLLNVADTGTKVLEWAAAAAVPVARVGLAFHGAALYTGLLATGLAFVVKSGLSGFSGLALNAAVGAEKLGTAGAAASRGLFGVALGAEKASALPWGWIAAAHPR